MSLPHKTWILRPRTSILRSLFKPLSFLLVIILRVRMLPKTKTKEVIPMGEKNAAASMTPPYLSTLDETNSLAIILSVMPAPLKRRKVNM